MARPVVSVIDPDGGVRESLRALLGTLELEVATFPSAEGFLTSLDDAAPPACLINGIPPPRMSGMDLHARRRSHLGRPHAPGGGPRGPAGST